MLVNQASTPNVTIFQDLLNKTEVIVEHNGNKSHNKTTHEIFKKVF